MNGANGANGANGNKAIFNNALTPEVEQVTVTIVRPKISTANSATGFVTAADSSVSGTDEALTNTNMYIIVGVIGGFLLAVGVGVLTFFLVRKQNEK